MLSNADGTLHSFLTAVMYKITISKAQEGHEIMKQPKDYRDTDEWQETHGMTDEQREAIIDNRNTNKGDNK